MKSLFVSGRKYRSMQTHCNNLCEEVETLSETIRHLETDLTKKKSEVRDLKMVNQELKDFSQSFREFYKEVHSFPVVQSTADFVALSGYRRLKDYGVEVGTPVDYIKEEILRDLVHKIANTGMIQSDLINDPVTGEACLQLKVLIGRMK